MLLESVLERLITLKASEMKFWPCTFPPRKLRKKDQEILQEFADYFPNITLKNINTSYRDIITPTVRYVRKISQEAPVGNGENGGKSFWAHR